MFKRNPFKIAIVAFFVIFMIDLSRMDNIWEMFPYWWPFIRNFIIVLAIPVGVLGYFFWKFLGIFDRQPKNEQ